MTPFLDLATHQMPAANRDEIFREFMPKLASIRDDVEFDLILWSLAQRLAVDTEELLRQIGARWAERSGLLAESCDSVAKDNPVEALVAFLTRVGDGSDAPLLGMQEFAVEVTGVAEDRVKVACSGARRCCSFLEGMVRALCEAFGVTLRYIRQPKKAKHVLITFSCLA